VEIKVETQALKHASPFKKTDRISERFSSSTFHRLSMIYSTQHRLSSPKKGGAADPRDNGAARRLLAGQQPKPLWATSSDLKRAGIFRFFPGRGFLGARSPESFQTDG